MDEKMVVSYDFDFEAVSGSVPARDVKPEFINAAGSLFTMQNEQQINI